MIHAKQGNGLHFTECARNWLKVIALKDGSRKENIARVEPDAVLLPEKKVSTTDTQPMM